MSTSSRPFSVAVAALRTGATYLVVSLYVLVVGPPALLLGVFMPVENLVYVLSRAGVRLALALTGIRVRVTGRENIPVGKAVVFCANHESNIDAPVLFHVLHPRLHMLYKAEFARVPILGRAIRHARCVPVYRDDRDRSIRWLDEAVPMLRAGTPFLFYPEGTRSQPGVLLPFKKGGFIMAIRAQVPIVPVTMHGAFDAMKRGSALIFPATIGVRIGEPVDTAGWSVDDRDVIIDKVRARMQEMLASGPG
jgi:1-acyl-sn-glycerol-3-phosphate acyltransferase